MVMFSGLGEQLTPGGKVAAGQVTATVPVNPPLGVTVIVEFAEPPAVALAADPVAVKFPGGASMVTVKLFEAAL